MQCLARLLLVFACLLLGPLAVTADELPANTNKIKSLTPEQARKLAETFKGVTVEVEIRGYGKGPWPESLPLNGLTTLDADTATALAEFKGR